MTFLFLFLTHGYYIPFLLLQSHIDEATPLYLNDTLKYRLFFSLSFMYSFFVLGISIIKYKSKFHVDEIIQYSNKSITFDYGIYFILIIYFTFVILFALYYSYQTNIFSSLLEYFSAFGSPQKIKLLRQASNPELFGFFGYLFGLCLWIFFPLLSLLSLSISLYRPNIFFKILAFLAIAINIIFTLSSKSKYPTVHFMAMLLFFFLIWKGKIIFFKNKLYLLFFVIIIFLISSLFYSMVSSSFKNAMYYVLIRSSEIPNYALMLHFKYFPDFLAFLHGRDISLLCKLMGWEYVSSPSLLSHLAFGKGGNANAVFISGLWVNFGYLGIIIGSFLLGIYLQWIQIWLVRRPKTITRIALFGYLSIQVWVLSNVSIFQAIFSFGIVTAPIFIRIIEIIIYNMRIVTSKYLSNKSKLKLNTIHHQI